MPKKQRVRKRSSLSSRFSFFTNFNLGKKKLTSAVSHGTIQSLVQEFSQIDFQLISLEENAALRIAKGKFAPESWTGNYVREAFLYIPNKGCFLIKNSPILADLKNAAIANELGFEYHIDYRAADHFLSMGSVKVPYNLKEIPISKLNKNPVTNFAFGKMANKYSAFLKDAGVEKFPVWTLSKGLVDAQTQPFIRQAILRCMDNWSGLIGSNADLHLPYGVRFVSDNYHGPLNDGDELYSVSQIIESLKKASIPGLEIQILRSLRQSGTIPVNYNQNPFQWGKKPKTDS